MSVLSQHSTVTEAADPHDRHVRQIAALGYHVVLDPAADHVRVGYNEDAKIKRLAVYSDRWPIIRQSTEQLHCPMGFFARGFTKGVDESITDGLGPPRVGT